MEFSTILYTFINFSQCLLRRNKFSRKVFREKSIPLFYLSFSEALSVQPYELLLPKAEVLSYNAKRTKELMKSLRRNLNEMLDSVEIFLGEEK